MYIKRRLCGLYDCSWMKNCIFTTNQVNISTGRPKLNRDLLVIYYKKTIQKVIPRIRPERYLNFITHETFKIRKEQIQNLYIVVQ